MTNHKERIESLEAGLGGLQDSVSRMELGITDKFHQIENTLTKPTEAMLSNKEGYNSNTKDHTAKVDQFFGFQGTTEAQKVSLASFHLEGEANQWWQWLRRAYKEEQREITWAIFEEELWARFGPTECEDFDEDLSRVKQVGSLRDYQKEFEKLGNRVQGWTQKALVGTFMGIRMFKPK
ncbi:hypothetical protein GH714_030423 [Hevea brasiliensis]|uniref:Retrotransposon gag domain-containing protein n=1 Tax=Hevea brasiliensis TaxID=3981 RepID=A0A6A6NK52_HEVBR|nr:hypothetical protein GH714_030423 [Hevea brasiliensis]